VATRTGEALLVKIRPIFYNEPAIEEGARLRSLTGAEFLRELEDAVWAGDTDKLHYFAPCGCCCDEHTFEDCPARVWGACRGQSTMIYAERDSWAKHYERFHGMTEDQFFGWGDYR